MEFQWWSRIVRLSHSRIGQITVPYKDYRCWLRNMKMLLFQYKLQMYLPGAAGFVPACLSQSPAQRFLEDFALEAQHDFCDNVSS